MQEINEQLSATFKIETISPKNIENLRTFLTEHSVTSAFACPEHLLTYCDKPQTKIQLIKFQKEEHLLIQVNQNVQTGYRILFQTPSPKFISEFQTQFHPKWIVNNLITTPDEKPIDPELLRYELTVDINHQTDNPHLKRESRICQYWCEREKRLFQIVKASPNHRQQIKEFLDEWGRQTKLGNADNDRHLLDLFLNEEYTLSHPEFSGLLFFDQDKIIGITFWARHPNQENGKKSAAAIIGKNLRHFPNQPNIKYVKLGEWLMLKRLEKLKQLGYEQMLIGGAENFSSAEKTQADYKLRFADPKKTKICYSQQILDPNHKTDILPKENVRSIWTI
jgi:hypothetical protein